MRYVIDVAVLYRADYWIPPFSGMTRHGSPSMTFGIIAARGVRGSSLTLSLSHPRIRSRIRAQWIASSPRRASWERGRCLARELLPLPFGRAGVRGEQCRMQALRYAQAASPKRGASGFRGAKKLRGHPRHELALAIHMDHVIAVLKIVQLALSSMQALDLLSVARGCLHRPLAREAKAWAPSCAAAPLSAPGSDGNSGKGRPQASKARCPSWPRPR